MNSECIKFGMRNLVRLKIKQLQPASQAALNATKRGRLQDDL